MSGLEKLEFREVKGKIVEQLIDPLDTFLIGYDPLYFWVVKGADSLLGDVNEWLQHNTDAGGLLRRASALAPCSSLVGAAGSHHGAPRRR